MTKSREVKPYCYDGIADIRDAVALHALEKCISPAPCLRLGCCLYAWCPKASRVLPPDLRWVLRADARKRKAAKDRARRAGR